MQTGSTALGSGGWRRGLREGFQICGDRITIQNAIRRRVLSAEDVEGVCIGVAMLPLPWPNDSHAIELRLKVGRPVLVSVTSGLGRRSATEALGMLTRWAEAWGVAMDVDPEELVFN